MQFPILETYTSIEWEEIFKQLPLVKSEEDKEIIKNILCKDKQGILREKETLKRYGAVNGVGPWWIPSFVRVFLTWILPIIDWFWHDLGILISRTKKMILDADRGVKKYGFVSIQICTEYRELNSSIFTIGYDYFIAAPFKAIIVYITYGLLRIFSRFSAKKISI